MLQYTSEFLIACETHISDCDVQVYDLEHQRGHHYGQNQVREPARATAQSSLVAEVHFGVHRSGFSVGES